MKKTYLNPQTETMPVMSQIHLCDVSPGGGVIINSGEGGPISGGGSSIDPGNGL